MLSLGSLPSLLETNVDTTVLFLHTKNPKFTPKFSSSNVSAFRGRLKHRFGRDLLCLLGNKNKHIRALGKSFGTSENGDDEDQDEPDDVLHATIEKSRKVLALQRELLQQVFLLFWNVFFTKRV